MSRPPHGRKAKSRKFLSPNPSRGNDRLVGTPKCDCGAEAKGPKEPHPKSCALMRPDWGKRCIVCGQRPIVPVTDMCGPCTFGEAATAGGEW